VNRIAAESFTAFTLRRSEERSEEAPSDRSPTGLAVGEGIKEKHVGIMETTSGGRVTGPWACWEPRD